MKTQLNPLMVRALNAHEDRKREVAEKRAQLQREWIARAKTKTIEAAHAFLKLELEATELETRLVRRNQAVEVTFRACGHPLDLKFAVYIEEQMYDHVKADLYLAIDDSETRINSLADLGAELSRRGWKFVADAPDPTLAMEDDSGA